MRISRFDVPHLAHTAARQGFKYTNLQDEVIRVMETVVAF